MSKQGQKATRGAPRKARKRVKRYGGQVMRTERNRKRKLEKHLAKFPRDTVASKALAASK